MVNYWRSLEERFWEGVKVGPEESCWEWQKYCIAGTGYGGIYGEGRKQATHRVSWKLHFGEIPEGLFVCHTCDNRKCVNPKHLFLGTCKDNVHDMWNKGRAVDPPHNKTAMPPEERKRRNAHHMSASRNQCKRGHPLPEYRPGKLRRCFHEDCAAARKRV